MAASVIHLAPQRRRCAAYRILRDLRFVRAMPPLPPMDKTPPLVNWGVIVTNAIGIVLGLAFTTMTGGMVYLIYRLPSAQNQILVELRHIQQAQRSAAEEITELKASDRKQDDRLLRLETN